MRFFTKLCVLSILLLVSVCCSANTRDVNDDAEAKTKVGVLLEAPISFCNDGKTIEIVNKKTKALFNTEKYAVLELSDGIKAIQIYRDENDIAGLVSNGWATYAVPLKKEDLHIIGNKLGCDYLFFMRLSNDVPSFSTGLFTKSAKTTIICDVRLFDLENGDYKFSKQIVTKGRSTAIYMGSPSFKRSYLKAFEKALKEVNAMPI